MKKIVIVQNSLVLELLKTTIKVTFPDLKDCVFYESNFEKTVAMTLPDEDLVVIASDAYFSEDNLFNGKPRDGSSLAEEIKKINSRARVYIFSMYQPRPDFIDGFYQKSLAGDNTINEMVAIFFDLDLVP